MSTRIKFASAVVAVCLVAPASALGSPIGSQSGGGSGSSEEQASVSSVNALTGPATSSNQGSQSSTVSSVSALTGADVPTAGRGHDDSTVSSVSALTGARDPIPTQAPASPVSADDPSGFDWGDAGIGAAISLAAAALMAGLYTQLRHTRSPVPASASRS
jgi:hypothetical protein